MSPTNGPADDPLLFFLAPEFRAQPLVYKLAAVMTQVSHVPKRGFNEFHKYAYVQEGDLVGTIRPLLAAAGIVIIPSLVSETYEPGAATTRRGETLALTRVIVRYTITDGTNELVMDMPGYGMDGADKGIYKALTGSMKYALMKLFEVDTGDDPERTDKAVDSAVSVRITTSREEMEKGGHAKNATRYQLQRIAATMREKGMDREDLLKILTDLFGGEWIVPEDPQEAQTMILTFLQGLTEEYAGQVIAKLDEWEPNADNAT